MQRLKMIGIVLCLTFLSSCSIPSVTIEMCANGKQFNKGRCFDFQISKDHIGKVSEDRDVPLSYLNNSICLPNDEPAKLIGYLHEIIEYSQDIIRGKYRSDVKEVKEQLRKAQDELLH